MRILLLCLLVACGSTDAEDPAFIAWGSSTSSINLRWLPVDGATGYELTRAGQTITLDGTDYLDFVDPGSYTYQLTALGTGSVQTARAATSEDALLVTGDVVAIGEPVTAALGAAGGSLELEVARATVPPGALPDGTAVTLQRLVAPTGDADLAIEIDSEAAPTQPIEIAFALDENMRAQIDNLVAAEKQHDGTWLTTPARIEGDRMTVTLPVAAARAKKDPRQVMLFAYYRINPGRIGVRANSVRAISAQAVFSEDPCEQFSKNEGTCVTPAYIKRPVTEARNVKNGAGTWTLVGGSDLGRLEGDASEKAISYFGPSKRPAMNRWQIVFAPKNASPAVANVSFLGNQYRLEFKFNGMEQPTGEGLVATVADAFDVTIEVDGDGLPVRLVDGPQNYDDEISNERPSLPSTTVVQTSPSELFTVTAPSFSWTGPQLTALLAVEMKTGSSIITLHDGQAVPRAGQTITYTMALLFDGVDFTTIETAQTFFAPPTDWRVVIHPKTDET